MTKPILLNNVNVNLLTYKLDKPIGGSGVSAVDILMVEIRDSEGVLGLGFSYVIGGNGAPLLPITEDLADRFLRNQPLLSAEANWRTINSSFNRTGRGWNLLALAAIDVALWDIHAKRAGQSLGVFMGGQERATPVYDSGPFQPGMDPSEATEIALASIEFGYTGVKPRINSKPEDGMLIRAVKKALPDHISLMLDVNEKGDLTSATRLLSIAKENEVLFVEEPLKATNLGGFRRLSENYGNMIATGEHLQGAVEFEPYITDHMAAILQPDVAMVGGLTPCLDLARVAEFHGLAIAPHFLPSLFVHLAAASPAVTWLESFPLLEPMFEGVPELNSDGTMTIYSKTRGHGLSLSEKALHLIKL
jgi:L-alanine-DL-glutamate epimerase-like enolase superfamily enzyme